MKKAFKLFKECMRKDIFPELTYLKIYGDGSGRVVNEKYEHVQTYLKFADKGALVEYLMLDLAEHQRKEDFNNSEIGRIAREHIDKLINEAKQRVSEFEKRQPLNKEMFDNFPNDQSGTATISDPHLTNPVIDNDTTWTVDFNIKFDDEKVNPLIENINRIIEELVDIRVNGIIVKGNPEKTKERAEKILAFEKNIQQIHSFCESMHKKKVDDIATDENKFVSSGIVKYSKSGLELKEQFISFLQSLEGYCEIAMRDKIKDQIEKFKS